MSVLFTSGSADDGPGHYVVHDNHEQPCGNSRGADDYCKRRYKREELLINNVIECRQTKRQKDVCTTPPSLYLLIDKILEKQAKAGQRVGMSLYSRKAEANLSTTAADGIEITTCIALTVFNACRVQPLTTRQNG
ncbi:predicted protein [Pyrenophora tritici-repentis Pt-1C-BFP]|uniref:Uncharacterized protein n=1 Tax=Pyrenophora tritici-repentis (strain Pt-1C-BFP) TaxID=426418 RepID=B2VTN1_PYRTR|nr:uncharacterized protein PTRG_00876 [Pyrenophora tritici-repentis Pt-1C-BFP]EDU40314.1 predicted protein [Pyrenophora tritici-repentis Pt-1C-BFP]